MENSNIEWTDHTFNPWIGCAKVSPGCKNCYAEQLMDKRYGRVQWGVHGTRSKTSAANWLKPKQWNANQWQCPKCLKWAKTGGACGAKVLPENGLQFRPGSNMIEEAPAWEVCNSERVFIERPRVFCASLADVFEDRGELAMWRAELFTLIDATPNLDWLLLTKRPENILKHWPLRNVGFPHLLARDEQERYRHNIWLGTSVENQQAADERIPHLLKAKHLCKYTFLSCEPLLGPVDLRAWMPHEYEDALGRPYHAQDDPCRICGVKTNGLHWVSQALSVIDWVIAGGESGKDARPMHPDWARSLRDQCKAAGVAFLFKQWGEYRPGPVVKDPGFIGGAYIDGHGHTAIGAAVSHDFGDGWGTVRVGKHAAGRLLDGVEHNGFPQ